MQRNQNDPVVDGMNEKRKHKKQGYSQTRTLETLIKSLSSTAQAGSVIHSQRLFHTFKDQPTRATLTHPSQSCYTTIYCYTLFHQQSLLVNPCCVDLLGNKRNLYLYTGKYSQLALCIYVYICGQHCTFTYIFVLSTVSVETTSRF